MGILAKCVVILYICTLLEGTYMLHLGRFICIYCSNHNNVKCSYRALVPGATDRVNEKTRTSPPRPFPVISAKAVILFDRNGF